MTWWDYLELEALYTSTQENYKPLFKKVGIIKEQVLCIDKELCFTFKDMFFKDLHKA